MILILSNAFFQSSMDNVIDWLIYKKKPFVRINGLNDSEVTRIFSNLKKDVIEINDQKINLKDIKSVWFFRWGQTTNESDLVLNENITSAYEAINKQLQLSRSILSNYFFEKLKKCRWLGHPTISSLNKLIVLKLAEEKGLLIPPTIIVTDPDDIIKFKKKHINIITKPIWEIIQIECNNRIYSSYTTEVNFKKLKKNYLYIYPSLLQKKINKKMEIRSFYLHGIFYSMAIFSQNDKQTEIDFRYYNESRPNRTVPYKLPRKEEIKLNNLISAIGLNTCSIDIILDTENQYFFLEINPVGQFAMTSKPCNYNIEKIISSHL